MKRNKELDLGLIMLIVGGGYFAMSLQIPAKDMVDARTFPFIIAGLMCALGLAQIYKGAKASSGSCALLSTPAALRPVLQTCGLLLLFAVLLEPVGFIPTSALYMYFQSVVLTPPDKTVRPGLYAAVAIITAVVVFFTFRSLFDMMLPVGILSFLGL